MSHPIDKVKEVIKLTPELEEAFERLIVTRKYRRGETITAVGDMQSYLFYIVHGSARVFFLRSGKEHTYSLAFDDEYIPLSFPLVMDSDYVTTIEFLEPTTIALIPISKSREFFRQIDLTTMSLFIDNIFKQMLRGTVALQERILMLQTCSAPERYRWLIKRYPKILERANLTQIASYLGITKETLYRIRSGKYTDR